MRLSNEGKNTAAYIYKSLKDIAQHSQKGKPEDAIKAAKELLRAKHIEVEYLESANAKTLELTNKWQEPGNNIVLLAAYLENVRLIDNLQF